MTRLERWLLRFLVRRQVARGFNDGRELTAMWRMVSEEAYKITPGHGTAVLLGQTLNRAQTERKAHELRRQLSEIEKTQRKNRVMNDDYEKGKADERKRVVRWLKAQSRSARMVADTFSNTPVNKNFSIWSIAADEAESCARDIEEGKHDN